MRYNREAADRRITRAASAEDYASGRNLIEGYARELGMDLGFQGFHVEIQQLPEMYGKPDGCLLIAWSGSKAAGCVGLRKHDTGVSEMKRLYVRPEYRGQGLGRLLVQECIRAAISLGYRQILMDTLPDMKAAHALYESLGFQCIDAYYDNPIAGTRYLGLIIT